MQAADTARVPAQAGVQAGEPNPAEAMVETIVEEQVGVAMLAATVQLELSGSEVGAEDGVQAADTAGVPAPAGRQMCQLAR